MTDTTLQPLAVLYQYEQQKANAPFLHQPVKGNDWRHYTWAEATDQIRRMATALQAMNLPPKQYCPNIEKLRPLDDG